MGLCGLGDHLAGMHQERREQTRGPVPILDANARRGGAPEMEPAQMQRYKERSTAERGNARLKGRVRWAFRAGAGRGESVPRALFFALMALTADALLKLVQ